MGFIYRTALVLTLCIVSWKQSEVVKYLAKNVKEVVRSFKDFRRRVL